MNKKFVIAGNYNQGLDWAESDCKKRWNAGETSISLSDYIIVSSPQQLRGIQNPHGVFVGMWRERNDILEIVETLFINSHRANSQLEQILNEFRNLTGPSQLISPSMILVKGSEGCKIFDTNPLPMQGRCAGVFKLPADFTWRKII